MKLELELTAEHFERARRDVEAERARQFDALPAALGRQLIQLAALIDSGSYSPAQAALWLSQHAPMAHPVTLERATYLVSLIPAPSK